MKKIKFKLYKTTCKRCGVSIYTGNKSLFGMDDIKAKYGKICSECMTPEEKIEMDLTIRGEMGKIVSKL